MADESKRKTRTVWGASPAGTTFADGAAPGTKDFFTAVLARRSRDEMPWLKDLVPFEDFAGRRILEVGCGAGYDAYEWCRHGADYVGLDLVPENPQRTRRHLAHFGLEPRVLQGDAETLPFPDGVFDGVFSNGVLHHTPDFQGSISEIRRVLKPGGAAWLIVYHRWSVFYLLTLGLFDHLLRGGWRERSFRQRLAQIEYSTSDDTPLVRVYGRGELRRVLRREGLKVESTHVRKLTPEDLPNFFAVRRLKSLPRALLDRVGHWFGWYVVVRARKV